MATFQMFRPKKYAKHHLFIVHDNDDSWLLEKNDVGYWCIGVTEDQARTLIEALKLETD